MTKKRRNRKKQQKQQKNRRVMAVTVIVALVLAGVVFVINRSGGIGPIAFRDIHGISYSPQGALYVATHDGLRIYQDGWRVPDTPVNDYMGYSGTEDGFFSSGHPGPQSRLPNPLGLIRSTDFGATVTMVNFTGESDFHVMGASYRAEVVYVFNPRPNSVLGTGLHISVDGGQTWAATSAAGLGGNPSSIAVHPDETNMVAVATSNGVFLSSDSGNTFQAIDSRPATAAAFDTTDGSTLYFGLAMLSRYSLDDGTLTALSTPELNQSEVVLFIATAPGSPDLAIATSEYDVYVSTDSGSTWQQVARTGRSTG